ncbi:MAG: amino acid adenylation domain-containing protein, partial [Myxococcota bacterium]|nr:amino acid adenylation domain-containing protein [Myxococcota bacterium]
RAAPSTQMLVALLATWRVGAAYVPIDPAHPALRSAVVLEDAHARAMITQRSLGALEGFEGPTLFVDEEPSVDAPSVPPSVRTRPPRADDVAYVLFTSGSTGRPKGVAIGHRAFATFLRAMAHEPGLGADDRLLAITTLGFDIAGLELFLPLVVGATVEIADRELALDPNTLRDRLLRAPTITTLQATPTTWRMLIEAGLPTSSLRALVGGEALPRPLASALLPRVRELWNLYGPTETTVWSTTHRVRERDLEGEIPIGRPIAGTRTYVLDPRRQLVPAGVVGELWIGGLGVADGYLGRPELTAERFVDDPFVEDVDSDAAHDERVEPQDSEVVAQSTQRRARMYRTGDLASLDPEGVLHYHGRVDRQIKLRGHRIEPGEIEHVLALHPRVRAAVVRVRERASGPRLEAFVEADAELGPSELAAFARTRLPEYMVPASVGVLEVFPLTPSGKVDLAALPFDEDTSIERAWAPPTDDLELLVGVLFSELLGVAQVGRDDDFFALGGHSLLALQLARRVREEVGAELGVGRVLEARTVAALAQALRQGHSSPPSLVPLVSPVARERSERVADAAPLFFVCGIHLYHEVARHLADVPSFGLFAPIEEEIVAALQSGRPPPKLTVRDMADRYVELLVRGRRSGAPLRLAGSSFGGVLAFEMARVLRARGEEVELVVLLDSLLPSAVRRSWSAWARARWEELDLASAGSMVRRAARSVSQRPLGRTVRHAVRRLGLARSEDVRAPHEPAAGPHDVEVLRERLYLDAMSVWERESDARYDGDVLVVRASDRHEHVSDRIAPDLGWGARVRGAMEVVEVPGDHLGIVHGASAARVAEEIRRRLAPARAPRIA